MKIDYKPVKKFMHLAIEEAKKGNQKFGQYPFGAVVVKGNKVISKSHNGQPNTLDSTAHAEILAIKKATEKLKTRYLEGCVLYTTNEPCAMCTGAVIWANMDGIIFGAKVSDLRKFWRLRRNKKTSTRKFIFLPCSKVVKYCFPKPFVIGNFLRKECLSLFKLYDSNLRR